MSDPYGTEAALAELEAQNPQTIRWESNNYPVIVGDIQLTKDLGFGGYTPAATLTVIVRKSIFPDGSLPQLKDDITYLSKPLHLDSIRHSPDGVFMVWGLTDPAKGA